jgi:Mrp family chromosome partitioning ATPase
MAHHFEVLRTAEEPAESGRGERADSRVAPQRQADSGWHGDQGAVGEIAKLVQRVFVLPGSAKAPGAVAFCGVEAGAGCSWICARCGEALAEQVAGSVCLVDGNLRRPSLHDELKMSAGEGFTEAMKDTRPINSFAKRMGKSNLWLLSAGGVGREPNGSLSPARLSARFSDLRAQFDYVLIDTPPVGVFSDGMLLAQLADGAIFVVGSGLTRRESARMVKESFDVARVPVLGVVLNRRTYPMPEALYRRL